MDHLADLWPEVEGGGGEDEQEEELGIFRRCRGGGGWGGVRGRGRRSGR